MEEANNGCSVRSLIGLVNDVASISDYRYAVRRQYCNLARRLKLLIPMFEEMRDMKKQALADATVTALASLKEALESTKELLRLGSEGSKIYLVRFLSFVCYLFRKRGMFCPAVLFRRDELVNFRSDFVFSLFLLRMPVWLMEKERKRMKILGYCDFQSVLSIPFVFVTEHFHQAENWVLHSWK